MTSLEYEGLTEQIIGAAIEVQRKLGPGFLESFYQKAMLIELRKRELKAVCEVEVTVRYDGVDLGVHRLDLIVEDKIVVELKAIKEFEDIHFAIVKSYLRASCLHHGLLINFGKQKVDPRRVIAK